MAGTRLQRPSPVALQQKPAPQHAAQEATTSFDAQSSRNVQAETNTPSFLRQHQIVSRSSYYYYKAETRLAVCGQDE
ncbi:hypothetical protein PG988_001448 [Apiospora saccharicola]